MKFTKNVIIDFEIVLENWYFIPTFYIQTEAKEIGFEFLCFGLYFQINTSKYTKSC